MEDNFKILVIGAGGLGCEMLKDLALSGFRDIHVIDMDTIDVSNLNRQFLFRMHDVGKPKAVVAAERVMQRVSGVTVTAHYGRIEEKDASFYRTFDLIMLGLDSLEARSYINSVVCSFLEYDEDGQPDMSTITPMVDGGTEGFRGHARVIVPGVTPCFNCTLWLFPPQVTFPLCTIAETPRSPAHCIEYVHIIQWRKERKGESFDSDNAEHMKWMYEKALKRAAQFNISGVTYSLTQGVVKNIIPAIASTNAIISAMCSLEALKAAQGNMLITTCAQGLDNYIMYVGTQGVYSHTVSHGKDPNCIVCSPWTPVHVDPSTTLRQFIDMLIMDARFKGKLAKPSISHQGNNLYMQAPAVLEEMTRPNLEEKLATLMGSDKGVLNVNDKKLAGVLRVQVSFYEDTSAQMEC